MQTALQFNPNPDLLGTSWREAWPPALCERVPDATVISFGPSATCDPGRRRFPLPLSRLSPSSGSPSAGICPCVDRFGRIQAWGSSFTAVRMYIKYPGGPRRKLEMRESLPLEKRVGVARP